jgi:hypothetical protein
MKVTLTQLQYARGNDIGRFLPKCWEMARGGRGIPTSATRGENQGPDGGSDLTPKDYAGSSGLF